MPKLFFKELRLFLEIEVNSIYPLSLHLLHENGQL
jgi:hypothetical protein